MRILTLNRIILFFLLLVFLSIKSCINSDNIIEDETVVNQEIKKSLLPDEDQVVINSLENYIVLDFNKKNKNKYIASFNILPNNILKIELHKFIFIDNIRENIVNNYIIENINNYKYEIIYNEEEINFSVKDFYLSTDYNNMISYKSYQNNQHQISFIDLSNKQFCSDKNSAILSTEKGNHELILNIENNKFNNLSCGDKQLIGLLNTYKFQDKRDFSLLPEKELLANIKENIKKSIINYDYIDFYYDDEYFYFNLNQDIKTNKSIKINNENRQFTLQISELPLNNSIPVTHIKISKKDILNNPEFLIDIHNYDESIYYNEVHNSKVLKKVNLGFYKNNFSVIKDLDCQEFSYSNMTQKFDNNQSTIYFNKNTYDKNYKCQIKPLISHISNKDSVKYNNGLINYSLFLKEKFDIDYDDNKFIFSENEDYHIYDYAIENNQLFLYVDKESNDYKIINEKIKKIEIPYFSNINVINVENKEFMNTKMREVLHSYRQINEELNINIFKFSHIKNVEYYILRSNSIQFNEKIKTCNFNYSIDKISSNKYDLNINDEVNGECNKYGVSVIILKKIGYNTELSFKENRSDLLLNHLKDKHDIFHKSKNNIESEKFKVSISLLLINKDLLNYSINIEYLENNFDINLETYIDGDNLFLIMKENNDIKRDKKEHILIPVNGEKKINIIYKDLDGKQEKFVIH